MPKKHSLIIYSFLSCIFLLEGCPNPGNPVATPTPVISPSPVVSVSSIPVPIDPPKIILDNYFKVEFGPSTKGVSNFGPSSKGINNNFGPGPKGVSNLKFNVNFAYNLLSNDASFTTKDVSDNLKLNDVKLSLQRKGEHIADIYVLPKSSLVEIGLDTNIEPGEYDLVATANNNFEPLNYSTVVNLESNLEVKVILYAKEPKREDLDIAIRTKPIKPNTTTN